MFLQHLHVHYLQDECIEVVVSVAVFMVYIYVIRLTDQKLEWHNKDNFVLCWKQKKHVLCMKTVVQYVKNLTKHSVEDQN